MLPLRRHRAPSPVDSPALPSQQRPAYLRLIDEGRKLDGSMTTSTLSPRAIPQALSERLKNSRGAQSRTEGGSALLRTGADRPGAP
jgi:hypothetical protein